MTRPVLLTDLVPDPQGGTTWQRRLCRAMIAHSIDDLMRWREQLEHKRKCKRTWGVINLREEIGWWSEDADATNPASLDACCTLLGWDVGWLRRGVTEAGLLAPVGETDVTEADIALMLRLSAITSARNRSTGNAFWETRRRA